MTKKILTIGGTDPSSGAGLAADHRAIHALGMWPFSVVTAVVAQNTQKVKAWEPVSQSLVQQQLNAVLEDVDIDAIKIGMLGTEEVCVVVREVLKNIRETRPGVPIVFDPVLTDGTGETSLANNLAALEELAALATLVTPNAQEFDTLVLKDAAVLRKSGHDEGTGDLVDTLQIGDELITLAPLPRHDIDARGTGCTLASAIACYLAAGDSLLDAVENARRLVNRRIEGAVSVGRGRPVLGFER